MYDEPRETDDDHEHMNQLVYSKRDMLMRDNDTWNQGFGAGFLLCLSVVGIVRFVIPFLL
jgi:hypothetical protein